MKPALVDEVWAIFEDQGLSSLELVRESLGDFTQEYLESIGVKKAPARAIAKAAAAELAAKG